MSYYKQILQEQNIVTKRLICRCKILSYYTLILQVQTIKLLYIYSSGAKYQVTVL